jgi:putative spermidine/putrescine transport system permease protein
MNLSPASRIGLRIFMIVGLAFIYVPLLVVIISSFNTSKIFGWPPDGFTTKWWGVAAENQGVRDALATSLKAGLGATVIALVLGTMISLALQRYSFFGRDAISFLVILPIALPGIVTGIALNTAIRTVFEPFGISFGLLTVVIGHSTFCIVVVFNNVIARLRRVSGNLEEASMDLGASTFQTFRYVTFPAMRSALVAGALLAFGLSFDEIVVTTFTAGPGVRTLPLWIYDNLFRPNQAPVVNVVAAFLVIVSIIPIWASQRLASPQDTAARLP